MEERVRKICGEVCKGANLDSQTLMDDGILDSVTMMELISELMEEFEIEIPYREVKPENFNSVRAMAMLVEKYSIV